MQSLREESQQEDISHILTQCDAYSEIMNVKLGILYDTKYSDLTGNICQNNRTISL